ncbi:ACP S-malonyltransferase [Antarctobacter jejuensis]|uniref:ACP S-malonyltransferase n=1 Tax=Antarctobacter jejuensis TaxID=1439938 RepID=UPI003FD3137F
MNALPSRATKVTDSGTAFLFPGQGSQYPQMGRMLFEGDPVFRAAMTRLDRHLMSLGEPSVLDRLYAPGVSKEVRLDDTVLTHPAIFMVEVALAERLIAGGVRPDCVLGSSLGEYAAAVVAGVLPAEEMLECVLGSARAIADTCPPGAMLAAMASIDRVMPLAEGLTVAGVYGPENTVLSGAPDRVAAARARLSEQRILAVDLPVGHAFHAPELDPAAARVSAVFKGRNLSEPTIPMISCRTGAVVRSLSPEHFATIGRAPILFREAVQALGEKTRITAVVDVGPSGSQATLVRQAAGRDPGWNGHAILSPYAGAEAELRQLQKVEQACARPEARAARPVAVSLPKTAVVFAGQGSQFKGMGQALFERFPEQVAQADAILGYSISDLCLQDPEGRLRDTRYTQPAIFVVNDLAWQAHLEEGDAPDILAGHSLGEMNALVAGGAMDFATGLRVVQERAARMGEAQAGGMSAVLGLGRETIAKTLAQAGLDQVDIANINTPSQIVISGDAAQVKAAAAPLEAAGAKAVLPLPVGGAFHSRLMQPAEQAFAAFVNGVDLSDPGIPVLSNISACPYGAGEVASGMVRLLSRPVDWVGCVTYMLEAGVDRFVEIAPKPVLANMIAETRKGWTGGGVPVAELPRPVPRPTRAEPIAPAPAEPVSRAVPRAPEPLRAKTQTRTAPALNLRLGFAPETLGSAAFRNAHGTRYAHICGAMVHGIASVDLVLACGRAGILSFFGSGGLPPDRVEAAIKQISNALGQGAPWGINLLNGSNEAQNVALFLRHGVRRIEASAYIKITKELVRYRLSGLSRDGDGVRIDNMIVAKLSRPEVARNFLDPAPEALVSELLAEGAVTPEMAELARRVPMADDICVEADSGGHTDQGVAAVLVPAICRLRDAVQDERGYATPVRIGAGGGIATPEAAVSALMLGAEFLVTGSINQCTVEAGTSDLVKQMLSEAEVQDTAYAPAGDMFEIGAKVQVLRRGVFFPARANRLFELYSRHDSLDEIDSRSRAQVEEKYFRKSFGEVWEACCDYWPAEAVAHAERTPKQKMAYVFRWYFGLSGRMALQGNAERKLDFQIHCGRSMGAFNQWVAGTSLSDWRARQVANVTLHLLDGTARQLETAITRLIPEHAQ